MQDTLQRQLKKIQKKLIRKKIYNVDYLNEAVDNQLRLMYNQLTRSRSASIKFLLQQGMTIREIYSSAKAMLRICRNHHVSLVKTDRKVKDYKHLSAWEQPERFKKKHKRHRDR